MLPAVISIRIFERGKRKFWLWLPMFFLWPVVLGLLGIAFVLVYVACLISGAFQRGALLFPLLKGLFQVFSAMRGLRAEIRNEEEGTLVDVRIS